MKKANKIDPSIAECDALLDFLRAVEFVADSFKYSCITELTEFGANITLSYYSLIDRERFTIKRTFYFYDDRPREIKILELFGDFYKALLRYKLQDFENN